MAKIQCVLSHYCTSFYETTYKGTNTFRRTFSFFIIVSIFATIIFFIKVIKGSVSCISFRKSSKIFRSPSFSLGLETFANLVLALVSENSVSEKRSRFRFRKIWSQKKLLVSVIVLVSSFSTRIAVV